MSASLPGVQLTDSHRLFLQALMWRRICDSNEITKIYTQSLEACKVPVPQPNEIHKPLYEFVTAINKAIKLMNLSITKCIDERTGRHHYALISGVDNTISHLAMEYSSTELEYFKKIAGCIICSNDGYISSTEALNLTHVMDKRVNKVDAQDILKRFLREKWLCQTNKGVLYLSPRCIAELDFYFTTNYEDAIVKCNLCQSTVIQGAKCALCRVKVHKHCIRKFLIEQNCCPKCHKTWEEYSGSTEEEAEEEASPTTRGRKRARE